MHLGGKTLQRSHLTLPFAVALIAFAIGCGDDDGGGAGGAGGSATGGTGGSAGATGGNGGEGGSGTAGTGGASGSGGATGSGGAAGSGATGGAAGSSATGGSAGSGATDAGSAGKAGASGAGGAAGGDSGGPDADVAPDPKMNFFVTSETSKTGNLGGLTGADARCQRLAMAVGFGSKTWHAYLSAEAGDGGQAVNARDRIGSGPYYNAKGVMLAADSTALHARSGDAEVFVTEKSQKVNGQWSGSPTPNEHDVLTGSMGDGTVLAGQTCVNWTSEAMTNTAQVGHADGLGPSMSSTPPLNSWNSAHVNGGCNDTAPKGGAGRIYCFVAP